MNLSRRQILQRLLALGGGVFLAACDRLSRSRRFAGVLGSAEQVNRPLQRSIGGPALAQEFSEEEISPAFRSNGTHLPPDPGYRQLAAAGFAGWELEVGGLVQNPVRLSLAELRALPSRTQITRHDCVEGWSAIAKWKGARLSSLLERVRPKPEARFVLFHCFDAMDDGDLYYESIGFDDAFHPQTLLAYEWNDRSLPVEYGAPLRLRVERQLGYKMAKYIRRIELVSDLRTINGGKGGYWEDRGYEWYAGI